MALAEVQNEPVPAPRQPSFSATDPMIIEAIKANAGDATIRAVIDYVRELRDLRSREAFNSAFAMAMLEMPAIKKTKNVKRKTRDGRPAGEYWYAPLEEIMGTVQPILNRHGMHLGFLSSYDGNMVEVTGVLRHVEGAAETTTQRAPKADLSANTVTQNKAATETSLMRSIAAGILGLAVGEQEEASPYQAAAADQGEVDSLLDAINQSADPDAITSLKARIARLPVGPARTQVIDAAQAKRVALAEVANA